LVAANFTIYEPCYDKLGIISDNNVTKNVIKFQERLEAASKDTQNDAICMDEDGCPIEPEVMVTCPLCKVTTSEKEIVENLFLTPSDGLGDQDDMPQTHMCDSCDDQNLASMFCHDCESNICDDCVKAHKKLKITKDHKLEVIEGSANDSASRSVSASIGNSYQLLF